MSSHVSAAKRPAGSARLLPGVPSSGPPRKVAYHEAVRLALGSLQVVDSFQGDVVREPPITTNARVRPGSGSLARPVPVVVASAQSSRGSSADRERDGRTGSKPSSTSSQPLMGAPGARAVLAADDDRAGAGQR